MSIYIIRSGDTLGKIATAFSTNVNDIMDVNPQIEDANTIFAGSQINIPGTTPPLATLTGEPKWLEIARNEMKAGVTEIAGRKDNKRILEYHATTTLQATDDEVSWCSSFVNFCLKQAGIRGTNSAAARSWLKWGVKLTVPQSGCIVVFWRNKPSSWEGHVGFYVGEDSDGDLLILGGNQSDRVKISSFSKSHLLSYRKP